MIQDAQRSVILIWKKLMKIESSWVFRDDGSEDTSFMSGPPCDSASDFIDLTQKFWANFIRFIPRNKIKIQLIQWFPRDHSSDSDILNIQVWQSEQSPSIDRGAQPELTGSTAAVFVKFSQVNQIFNIRRFSSKVKRVRVTRIIFSRMYQREVLRICSWNIFYIHVQAQDKVKWANLKFLDS